MKQLDAPPSGGWSDIYSKLDPNMSQDDYDKLRVQYFNARVAPNVRHGYSVDSTLKQFMQQTDRPHSIGAGERALVRMGLATTAAAKGAIPWIDTSDSETLLHHIADREGISTQIPELTGNLVGQAVAMVPLFMAGGEASTLLAKTFMKGEKAIDVASKIGRGGLAFAAYDALAAKDGDRVGAALRGASIGAVTEAGLGLVFGFSSKAPETIVKAALNEKLPPSTESVADEWESVLGKTPGMSQEEIEKASAKIRDRAEWDKSQRDMDVTKVGGGSNLPPRTEMGFEEPGAKPATSDDWESTLGKTDNLSKEQIAEINQRHQDRVDWERSMQQMSAGEVHPVTLPTQKAAAEILAENVTEARARGYLTGPMVETPTIKGLRVIIKDSEGMPTLLDVPRGKESEIVGTVEETLSKGGSIDGIHYHPASRARATEFMRYFADKAETEDQPFRMQVAKGNAGMAARNLNKLGLRGTVIDDSTVQVGPEAPWVKAQKAKVVTEQIKAQQAGKLQPPAPDDISKKMMRIGELRNQIRQEVRPRADHAELHHLAGEVGKDYQLTRSQVGQLGLRYYEQSIGAAEPGSATTLLERFKGRGEKFGVTEGEKPPTGFDKDSRIRGYRKPTPSETFRFGDTESQQMYQGPGEIRERPTGRTKVMPWYTRWFSSGPAGAMIQTPEGPLRVLRDLDRDTLYHESIHEGINYAGLDNLGFVKLIADEHRQTYMQLGRMLRSQWAEDYGDMKAHELFNEVFTHAATAIRMGDDEYLAQLAEADTDLVHVEGMVRDTARAALDRTYLADNAPLRAFQRRMQDLVRRTDPFYTDALAKAQASGYTTWFDPESEKWVMRDGEGREALKNGLGEVWDHVDQADPSSHFPDIGHSAYFKGARGPIVPPGTEPVDGPVTLEHEQIPWGFQALSAITRPTLDWAASVQRKLDQYGVELGFYDAIKNIDDARRLANPVMDALAEDRDRILAGVPRERRLDYGELLSRPDTQWQSMAKALNLSNEDLANVRGLADWSAENEKQGGVSLTDTLRTMRQVREAGGDIKRALGAQQSKIGDAIRNGQLGYTDLHAGQVSQWVIRQSIDDRFMSEPLKALEDLAKAKTPSGKLFFDQLQWPIRNYVNYMKGIPDASQKILSSWIESMTKFGSARIKELNQFLPAGFQVNPNFSTPRELMSKYQLLLYTAGLGARPAVFIRDTFQSMYAMAVMGPQTFAEGMAKAMTADGQRIAREAGALIHGRNVGEFFGDVSGDLPVSGRVSDYAVKMADKLLAPSRIGHNIGRSIAYLGEYSRALREIARYRAGELVDPTELANRTGIWFQDAAPRARLLAMAADPAVPVEEAAKQFGLAMNDATQFALRSGTQGAGLRTGMGRIFGQYGTWPMNYIEFTRKLVARAADNPIKGVPTLTMWAGMNYGAFKAAQSMGIDAAKWLFLSPAGYAGSPNEELLRTIMAAPEESNTGIEARRKLHEMPLEYLPTGVEIQSIIKAIEDGDTSLARILGFKPLKDQPAQDFEDWLLTESGFTKKRAGEIEDAFRQ